MKRHLSIIMALAITFICLCGTTVFAAKAESTSNAFAIEKSDNGVVPYGSLSGYGQHWHSSSESTVGDFYVNVTGIAWPTAQLTLNIENFGSNDAVEVRVYRPDGTFAWGTIDNTANYITMSNKDNWHNIKFVNGQTGTYRIRYSIINFSGSIPGSGRINCWIY